jgi:hypothetical protein
VTEVEPQKTQKTRKGDEDVEGDFHFRVCRGGENAVPEKRNSELLDLWEKVHEWGLRSQPAQGHHQTGQDVGAVRRHAATVGLSRRRPRLHSFRRELDEQQDVLPARQFRCR